MRCIIFDFHYLVFFYLIIILCFSMQGSARGRSPLANKMNTEQFHIYMFICLVLFMIDINLNFPLSRPLMQIVLVLFIATFETLNYNEE